MTGNQYREKLLATILQHEGEILFSRHGAGTWVSITYYLKFFYKIGQPVWLFYPANFLHLKKKLKVPILPTDLVSRIGIHSTFPQLELD